MHGARGTDSIERMWPAPAPTRSTAPRWTLVLPVQRKIRFDLVAQDVNHSFWVPRFLTKRELIVDVDNQIDVDTTEVGTFAGKCAEFCGLDHWRMNFTVRVVPEAEYQAWLGEQRQEAGS